MNILHTQTSSGFGHDPDRVSTFRVGPWRWSAPSSNTLQYAPPEARRAPNIGKGLNMCCVFTSFEYERIASRISGRGPVSDKSRFFLRQAGMCINKTLNPRIASTQHIWQSIFRRTATERSPLSVGLAAPGVFSCGMNARGAGRHAANHLFGERFRRTGGSLYECPALCRAAVPFCFTV